MKTFEEIPVYIKSKELCLDIYKLANKKYLRDFGFKDQIQRAAVSVLSNIAEGFERGSSKEFTKFLYYSKGSIGEIRSLLNIGIDLEYLSNEEYATLKEKCVDIAKQISGFIKYLSSK